MQQIKRMSNISDILPDMASINISVGAVRIDRHNRSLPLNSIIDRARIAQKASNRKISECTLFRESFRKTMLKEQRMENNMRSALKNGEFVVFLQPKFDIQTNQAVAAEALVRWQDPQYGLISPGEFIPLFEKNGFIRYLDTEMFRQVCILLRKWLDAGKQPLPISVNVSKIQLTDSDFVLKYLAIRDQYQIPDGLLEIEFTESVLVEGSNVGEIIEAFRKKGISLSIDDFGTGTSSLNLLENFCTDVLKLDQQFFKGKKNPNRQYIIIENMVTLAKSLSMKTVAEGVERWTQVEFLKSIHCEMIQGFLFEKPLPVSEFEQKYIHKAE